MPEDWKTAWGKVIKETKEFLADISSTNDLDQVKSEIDGAVKVLGEPDKQPLTREMACLLLGMALCRMKQLAPSNELLSKWVN